MDKYLLILWNRIETGSAKIEEMAEHLQLSTKQTRRKLQKWQEEGWLVYQSGKGRGNATSIRWLRDVEQEYEEFFLESLKRDSIESVSKLLVMDWSEETKQRLMMAFQTKFGFHQEEQDSLIIPRFFPFITFHPLKTADVHSANMVANLYNRLVTLNADHTLTPELAHTWEYTDTSLVLYLRKDVAFHDGSILRAEDVVESLERMKLDENFANLWEPITRITSPAPLVVRLEFPNRCSYALQLLGLLAASIFKEVNGKLVGTGGFYLAEEMSDKTVLRAFKSYFGHRPLLDRVEFIQVPKEFQVVYYGGQETNQVETVKVESDSGFGIVVMNPYRNPEMRRREVRDYIHMLIAQHRHELSKVNDRLTENNEGCLIGFSKSYRMDGIPKPDLQHPIKLTFVEYTKETTYWLKSVLEKEGIEVIVEQISFHDMLYDPSVKRNTDIMIHGEIFELNQSFSYFFFLKHNYSVLHFLIEQDKRLRGMIEAYNTIPFEEWYAHHLEIEQYMLKESVCVPLYYVKRQIPFSIRLMNVEIKHFGYVDLAKLWMKNHG